MQLWANPACNKYVLPCWKIKSSAEAAKYLHLQRINQMSSSVIWTLGHRWRRQLAIEPVCSLMLCLVRPKADWASGFQTKNKSSNTVEKNPKQIKYMEHWLDTSVLLLRRLGQLYMCRSFTSVQTKNLMLKDIKTFSAKLKYLRVELHFQLDRFQMPWLHI